MDEYAHPFQCLAVGSAEGRDVIYLACQSDLFQIDCGSGETFAKWSLESKSLIGLLHVSPDNLHVAVATLDDKAIHILASTGLVHQSRRVMPKRPSSMAFSPESAMIYVADKFGDVYALPTECDPSSTINLTRPPPKKQKLNATELTVHSQRNLIALQNQQKLAEAAAANNEDSAKPTDADGDQAYGGEAQIGHVSMLTDILVTDLPHDGARQRRTVVVTADRDEHIRVSRAVPQTQVIEGFCYGHSSFVNRLCLLRSDILVSGGGDDCLYVWKLPSYELLQTLPLRDLVKQAERGVHKPDGPAPIAVTLLHGTREREGGMRLWCACEGFAGLAEFSLRDQGSEAVLEFSARWVSLEGEPLAMAQEVDRLIVSIDNIHKPGRARERRDEVVSRLQTLEWPILAEPLLKAADKLGGRISSSDLKSLTNWLYATENLRKRGNNDDF